MDWVQGKKLPGQTTKLQRSLEHQVVQVGQDVGLRQSLQGIGCPAILSDCDLTGGISRNLGVNLFPESIQEVEITFVSTVSQQTAAGDVSCVSIREPDQTPKHFEHSRGQDLGYDCHVIGVDEIRLFGALFQGIHCRRGLEVEVTVME